MPLSRRTLIGASIAAPLSLLSGCGDAGEALSDILRRNELVIGTSGSWAPWSYHGPDGRLCGFDHDVGHRIAVWIGVRPRFVEAPLDELLEGLESGRFDIVLSNIDATPDREGRFRFSDPYAFDRGVLVTRLGRSDILTGGDLKGRIVAFLNASSYEEVTEDYLATPKKVADIEEAFRLLLANDADAVLTSEMVYTNYRHRYQHFQTDLRIAAAMSSPIPVAVPMRRHRSTILLKRRVDEALAKLRRDGRLSGLSRLHFGRDITVR